MLEIYLDDVKKISLDEFLRIIENNVKLSLSVVSQKKIQRSEDFLKSLLTNNMLIYGINTGYGPLARENPALNVCEQVRRTQAKGVDHVVGKASRAES